MKKAIIALCLINILFLFCILYLFINIMKNKSIGNEVLEQVLSERKVNPATNISITTSTNKISISRGGKTHTISLNEGEAMNYNSNNKNIVIASYANVACLLIFRSSPEGEGFRCFSRIIKLTLPLPEDSLEHVVNETIICKNEDYDIDSLEAISPTGEFIIVNRRNKKCYYNKDNVLSRVESSGNKILKYQIETKEFLPMPECVSKHSQSQSSAADKPAKNP